MPMSPYELQSLARQSDVAAARLRADVDALRAEVSGLRTQLADLRGVIARYLAARDAAQPEAEKVARDEIERML